MNCPSRKRAWPKRGAAHREAKRLTTANREEKRSAEHAGQEVEAYKCGACGNWHVATKHERASLAQKSLQNRYNERTIKRPRATRIAGVMAQEDWS